MRRRKPSSDTPAPTLDPRPLQELAEETSPETSAIFADNYTTLLPHRVERIIHSVGTGERDTAFDAALSLKTSSSMAGALRMSQLCRQLEHALLHADLHAAAGAARGIALHVTDLQEALATRHPVA